MFFFLVGVTCPTHHNWSLSFSFRYLLVTVFLYLFWMKMKPTPSTHSIYFQEDTLGKCLQGKHLDFFFVLFFLFFKCWLDCCKYLVLSVNIWFWPTKMSQETLGAFSFFIQTFKQESSVCLFHILMSHRGPLGWWGHKYFLIKHSWTCLWFWPFFLLTVYCY